MSMRDFPESFSQAMLVGIMKVGKLGVSIRNPLHLAVAVEDAEAARVAARPAIICYAMLYYAILYYTTILYHIILYYTILYYTRLD